MISEVSNDIWQKQGKESTDLESEEGGYFIPLA